jgi:hypothetical protein
MLEIRNIDDFLKLDPKQVKVSELNFIFHHPTQNMKIECRDAKKVKFLKDFFDQELLNNYFTSRKEKQGQINWEEENEYHEAMIYLYHYLFSKAQIGLDAYLNKNADKNPVKHKEDQTVKRAIVKDVKLKRPSFLARNPGLVTGSLVGLGIAGQSGSKLIIN